MSTTPKFLLGLVAFYLLIADHIDYAAVAALLVVAVIWWVMDQ